MPWVYLFGTVVGLVVLATGLAGMCGVRWAGEHDHCREMVGLTAAWLACVANEWRRSVRAVDDAGDRSGV